MTPQEIIIDALKWHETRSSDNFTVEEKAEDILFELEQAGYRLVSNND